MRIAYITPYKGPTLVERRPVTRNLSLSNTIKIELIGRLLREAGHDVEVLSQGEVVESQFKWFPGFSEPKRFHPDVPVYYSSALPVRYVNGTWASLSMLRYFKRRHREKPFDIVIIFNLKPPHIACARAALRSYNIPVILEYEDDSFVDVTGRASNGLISGWRERSCAEAIKSVNGCIGVSPYLLSQAPAAIPKLLLRGVIGDDIVANEQITRGKKKDRIVFSGTHTFSNGVAELIKAWDAEMFPGWELHITGHGKQTADLERSASGKAGIFFRGLLDRSALVELLCSAKICINPHAVSETPGNVFAFKIIEYLGSGAHVVSTPMGALETELEGGITYMADNRPETIAATLAEVIRKGSWQNTVAEEVRERYGCAAVAKAMDAFISTVRASHMHSDA